MKVEQDETRQVANAHLERIGREARIGSGENVRPSKVLHANGLSDLAVEGVECLLASGLLVNVAQSVEVPVVVIPKGAGAGCMRAACRLFFFHPFGLVNRWVGLANRWVI